MKILFLIFSILTCLGCYKKERIKPLNFVEKEIILQDSFSKKKLCKMNLFIPIEYDTLLKWRDASDCGCCFTDKYRLTNSKSCLIKESGFLKIKYCKDSIDRLTIEHQCIGEDTFKLDTTFLNEYIIGRGDMAKSFRFPQDEWRANKIKNINGKEFIILDYFGQDIFLDKPYEQILAMTISKKTLITFRFQCYQNDCINFPKKAYQILNSVQIDTL